MKFMLINIFLELWAQLFKENLGTCRLPIKLEGTQSLTLQSAPWCVAQVLGLY